MSNASQFECNQFIKASYPEIQHGYKQSFESKYHGFTNYSTFKVAQYICVSEDWDMNMLDKEGKPCLLNSINGNLAGIHFNSGRELKEYMMKYMPLDSLKPTEYAYVNWNEIWEQLGQENEYGLAADIGLTGSDYEQIIRNQPELLEAIQNADTVAEEITIEDRKKFKIENSKIILKSFLTRMLELRDNPALKARADETRENIKRVVKDLYNTCRCFPETGDPMVDSYLSRCKLA